MPLGFEILGDTGNTVLSGEYIPDTVLFKVGMQDLPTSATYTSKWGSTAGTNLFTGMSAMYTDTVDRFGYPSTTTVENKRFYRCLYDFTNVSYDVNNLIDPLAPPHTLPMPTNKFVSPTVWVCMPNKVLAMTNAVPPARSPYRLASAASNGAYTPANESFEGSSAVVTVSCSNFFTSSNPVYFEAYSPTGETIYQLTESNRHANLQYIYSVRDNLYSSMGDFKARSPSIRVYDSRYPALSWGILKHTTVSSKDGKQLYVPNQSLDTSTYCSWNSTGTQVTIVSALGLIATDNSYPLAARNLEPIFPIVSFPTL